MKRLLLSALCLSLISLPSFADTATDEQQREARAKAYGHLMRSTQAARRGDYRKAAEEIQSARKLQPDAAAIHAQAAEMLLFIRRADEAEEAARRAHALAPENAQALRFLAQMATDRALGDPEATEGTKREALALIEKLDELGHGDREVLRAMTVLRLQLNDSEGALEAAQKWVELRPGDRAAVGQYISLLLETERDREALKVALNFAAKHPNDVDMLGFVQDLATRIEGWDLIEERFDAEPGLRTSNTQAQLVWGVALLELEQSDAAIRAFERALVADPEDEELRLNVARLYRNTGRMADAATLLHEVTAAEPSNQGALLMLGETLAEQGVLDGALNAFVAALRLYSTTDDVATAPVRDAIRRRMVQFYLANDQVQPAQELLTALEGKDDEESFELRARVALRAEEWEQARGHAESLRGKGGDAVADFIEAESWARSGRWSKAKTKFDRAIKALGPITYARAADIYLDLDRIEDGDALFEAWTSSDPDNTDAWFYRASYLTRADQLDRAEPMLRKVLEMEPDHATALNFLGYSLADAGRNLDEALEMIQRALEFDPWNGAYLDSLGWVYFKMGRFEDARAPLETAAREFPADAVILEHLGDLYRALGESDLARSAWSQALDHADENRSGIEEKIARLDQGVDEPTQPR